MSYIPTGNYAIGVKTMDTVFWIVFIAGIVIIGYAIWYYDIREN